MPVAGYHKITVTRLTTGYRATRRRILVPANEIPENETAFQFTSYHHATLPLVQESPLLVAPRTLNPTLPLCDITPCVLSGIDTQVALLAFRPPFHLDGGDTCCRCLFVFVSGVACHDVDARIEWHGRQTGFCCQDMLRWPSTRPGRVGRIYAKL